MMLAADHHALLACQAELVEWQSAADADPNAPKRFSMTAYTGGMVYIAGYGKVVFDLAGLTTEGDAIPMLLHHDRTQIVGHGEPKITASSIKISGVISGGGAAAQEVLTAASRGFPWKASVGVAPTKLEYVSDGAKATANGRTFKGPCVITRAGVLKETSFLPIAADPQSSVKVAATAAQELFAMNFEQWLRAAGYDPNTISDGLKKAMRKVYERDQKFHEWLQANGVDPAAVTDDQRPTLRASFDAENPEAAPIAAAGAASAQPAGQAGGQAAGQPAGQAAGGQQASGQPAPAQASAVQDFLEAQAAQTERIGRIRVICAGQHPELEAQAIRENWTAERTELRVYQLAKPTAPAIHASGVAPDARMLECALLMAVAHPEKMLQAAFGEQAMERAHKFRRIRFKELIHLCCAIDGRQVPAWGASDGDLIRAAFSTVSLPGILSNVAHKVMLAAYTAVPGLADRLCASLTATDFKVHTGYRMSGDFKMEEVGADGELTHAKLGESSYPYRVKTVGKIFGLSREMQINDDLGAFTQVPKMIGRGAALTKERTFWTLVLDNTGDFFHADNGNLITKVLGSDGLKLAVKALEEQTDDQDDPILVMGRYLVVPPALRETADELYTSTNVNTGGAATATKVPNRNIYAGRYEPLSSPYAASTGFHASASSTAWYLFGDPADVPAFAMAYLNGQREPVIEDAGVAPNILGNAWRGYLDFGVCQSDPAGAVKSTGLVS